MTLYVFSQRYDYSEFGRMVERRDLPRSWRGHWRFDVVDAYGVAIPPRNEEYSAESLLGQQLAGVYLASLGQPPHWFVEGSARVISARLAEDARVAQWNEQLPAVLAAMNAPDDFLQGKLGPDPADVAAYSFARFLMKDARRYNRLLDALRDGQEFTTSFSQIYGGGPAQVATAWVRSEARRLPRRPR